MSGAASLIGAVAIVAAIGVGAQLLADRLQVPSVAFLLLGGVVVGPEALGLVSPAVFGAEGLQAIVGLSVGIIVFEGAFHLTTERVREASSEALGLVTVGALVSLVGTALAVRVVFGTTWPVAVLVGSLLIATGRAARPASARSSAPLPATSGRIPWPRSPSAQSSTAG